MRWRKHLRHSVVALGRSRLRLLLSISSMAVGVAAVAMLFALGAGAERALEEALEELGRHLLVVNAGRTETNALRGGSRQVRTLELADWLAIVEQIPSVARAAPIASGASSLRVGRRSLETSIVGTTAEFLPTKNATLLAGRFIDDHDVAARARVAIVGSFVARELFFGEWPLGETLRVSGAPLTIIGVLEDKGTRPDGSNEDNQVIVPVSTALRRLLNVDEIDRIFVQASSKPAVRATEHEIRSLLRQRHGLDLSGAPDDFEILDQDALLAAQAETGDGLFRLVAGLAALALGLAGVGLLAVSLLSVRERYDEIGLRLAVGALRRDILFQFLVEALLVAALGGVAGWLLGACGILLGERLSGWPLALTWRSLVIPFLISLGIAVIFGAYPALLASRLDPIVALRSK